MTTEASGKILIVKLHALGDLVIVTPAIRHLRERMPDATIDLLTVNWSAAAVMNSPHIDKLNVVDDDIFFNRSLKTVLPTIQLVREIRKEKYDAAVIFHSNPMIKRFVRLCGIKQRFSFHSDPFNNGQEFSVLLDEQRHSAITAWELAELAVARLTGVRTENARLQDLKYEWFITDDESKQIDVILAERGLEAGAFAVIFPGGAVNPQDTSFVKRWSSGKFSEVAYWLSDTADLPVVLLGAGSDVRICSGIQERLAKHVHNLSGRYDLRITAAITSKARIALSNDSGPLHVASAVCCPVVGIFGPTGANNKLPPGEGSFVASADLQCSPCYFTYFKGCIHENIECQDQLTPDMVINVLEQALNKTADKFS